MLSITSPGTLNINSSMKMVLPSLRKEMQYIYINIQVTNEGMAASENDDALDSTKIDSEFVSKKVSD